MIGITPTVGRIVHYTLSQSDADQINRRRAHAALHLNEHRDNANGVIVHSGNPVAEGNVFPMIITRVWENDTHGVNGQVFLDGNDLFWATSIAEGEGPHHYAWPMFKAEASA
jgi:hypothetical protein